MWFNLGLGLPPMTWTRVIGTLKLFQSTLGIHVVEVDGSVSYYVWKVMFLGMSDAVFIFSTMLVGKFIRFPIKSV